jgi:2'-5' RNA ligase
MGDEQKIRAFFAVELGDAARRAASGVASALRDTPGGDGVRWVRPETLHVTLRFLGNIDADRIPELARRVRDELTGIAPFRLELGGVRAFPSPRRPRVIALELAPEAPLSELADAVEQGVVAAGFEPEQRAFRAHLTLGRVRGPDFPDPGAAPSPAPSAFGVSEAVLFRSELRPSGARHTALERLSLGRSSEGRIHPN